MRGLMTSFSKIGAVECTSSYGLMTEILANEWGFIGYAVTDIYDDVDLWTAVLNSGTTCFDTRGQGSFYNSTTLENCSLFRNQMYSDPLNAHLIDGAERCPATDPRYCWVPHTYFSLTVPCGAVPAPRQPSRRSYPSQPHGPAACLTKK